MIKDESMEEVLLGQKETVDYVLSIENAPGPLKASVFLRKTLEHSECCICLGKAGLAFGTAERRNMMRIAFICSLLSLAFTVASLCGMSRSSSVVDSTYWSRGRGEARLDNGQSTPLELHVGLVRFFHLSDSMANLMCD
jgi:hypothetical protein